MMEIIMGIICFVIGLFFGVALMCLLKIGDKDDD